MTKIPDGLHTITAKVARHYESKPDATRYHLGASLIGHHCERWIWLSFRWVVVEKIPGRIRRLFERGHREEQVMRAELEAIGCKFDRPAHEPQARVNLGGHVSGSLDGIIESGLPGAEKTRHVVEFKTHNDRSFKDLTRNAVRASKPQHWVQMQVYMHGTGAERALYYAVNKNDDEIYPERVRYDGEAAIYYIERGKRLSVADELPQPISDRPGWYQCKMCPAWALCHTGKTEDVQRTCRSCAWSTATPEGGWQCEKHGMTLAKQQQEAGCPDYEMHDHLAELGNASA